MGGPGSGFYGHAGRPGLVGGSSSFGGLSKTTITALKKTADTIRNNTIETMFIIDPKTGAILEKMEGTEDEAGDPEKLEESAGKVQLHNHPIDQQPAPGYPTPENEPPSAQDLGVFLDTNPAVFMVASKDYNFVITAPAKPWTDTQKQRAEALFKQRLYTDNQDVWRYPTHEDWEWLAKQTGLTYSRLER